MSSDSELSDIQSIDMITDESNNTNDDVYFKINQKILNQKRKLKRKKPFYINELKLYGKLKQTIRDLKQQLRNRNDNFLELQTLKDENIQYINEIKKLNSIIDTFNKKDENFQKKYLDIENRLLQQYNDKENLLKNKYKKYELLIRNDYQSKIDDINRKYNELYHNHQEILSKDIALESLK